MHRIVHYQSIKDFVLKFIYLIHLIKSYGVSGFPVGSYNKSACNAGDPGSIPRLGRSPEEKNGPTLIFLPGEFHGQRSLADYSPWVTESRTWPSDSHTHTHTHTHSLPCVRHYSGDTVLNKTSWYSAFMELILYWEIQ